MSRRAASGSTRAAAVLTAAASCLLLTGPAAPARAAGTNSCHSVTSTTITPSVLRGGDGAVQTVTLSGPASGRDEYVSLDKGEDYSYGRTSIDVPVGQRSVSFPVRFDAPGKKVVFRYMYASGCAGRPQYVDPVTVLPLDPAELAVQAVTLPDEAVDGQRLTATLALTAPARSRGTTARILGGGGVLGFGGGYVQTVRAGGRSVDFPVRVSGVRRPGYAAIAASLGTSTRLRTVFVVPKQLSVTAQVGVSGASQFLVGLGAPAPAGGARVAVRVAHPDVHAPAYVTVPEGRLGAAFPLTVDEYPDPRGGSITVSRGGATSTEPFTFS